VKDHRLGGTNKRIIIVVVVGSKSLNKCNNLLAVRVSTVRVTVGCQAFFQSPVLLPCLARCMVFVIITAAE
jgi:hypothetical protein